MLHDFFFFHLGLLEFPEDTLNLAIIVEWRFLVFGFIQLEKDLSWVVNNSGYLLYGEQWSYGSGLKEFIVLLWKEQH